MIPIRPIVTVLLLGFALSSAAAVHQYHVTIDEKISNATVNICFDGTAPDYLEVESKLGLEDLIEFPQSNQGNIEIQGRYWKTKQLPVNACLDYKVSLTRHYAKINKKLQKKKNIIFVEDNTWLWLPEKMGKSVDVELIFSLPEWAKISTPWQQMEPSMQRYRIGSQPQNWGYRLMVGDFDFRQERISNGHYLNIASVNSMSKSLEINRWLVDIAQSVQNYLGDFPSQQTQIILISKSGKKRGPVPWGDVSRGNGLGLLFVIAPSYNIEEFYADWTASHEFSHLLLPKIHYDDIWLSEGLASYLQNVIMAQAGQFSKEEAWLRIYKGFERGKKGADKIKNEPLSLTSSHRKGGGRSGRTMRIYWSGALYFLKADIALRQQSGGKVGLKDVLLKLRNCCLKYSKTWSGATLSKKLDSLSNSKIFSSLYQEFSNGTQFPEYQSTYKQLGISFSDKNELSFKKNSLAHKIVE